MAIPPINMKLNTCYWCKEQLDTEPHDAHPVAGTDTPNPPGLVGGHGGHQYMMGPNRCWR